MTIGSQMPELDQGAFLPPPPYKIGNQNTPYKLGLKAEPSCAKVVNGMLQENDQTILIVCRFGSFLSGQ